MTYRLIAFLLLNFGALAIGGQFTNEGVSSGWYESLNKAPWTPPGWVFGFAWTTIMICFSVYCALLWSKTKNKQSFAVLFVLQWMLNVAWNPVFFYFHMDGFGLFIISSLTVLIGFLLFSYWSLIKLKTLLIAPYLVWLLIATTLNAFIFLKN